MSKVKLGNGKMKMMEMMKTAKKGKKQAAKGKGKMPARVLAIMKSAKKK